MYFLFKKKHYTKREFQVSKDCSLMDVGDDTTFVIRASDLLTRQTFLYNVSVNGIDQVIKVYVVGIQEHKIRILLKTQDFLVEKTLFNGLF